MKKIITMLLTISLIVGTLSIHAYAAEYGGSWADYLDYWKTWLNQVQIAADAPEETDPAETEEPAMEEPAVPEESEEPEVPVESEAPAEYRIRYDANGGYWWYQYSSPAISSSKTYTKETGETHTIISAPNRTSYTFCGWADQDGNIYHPGDKITVTANLSLKAQWSYNG